MSSRIIENILRNQSMQSHNVMKEFDFSKGMLNTDHDLNYHESDIINDMPVNVAESSWQKIDTREVSYFYRSYTLDSRKIILYFVNEVLKLSESMQHYPDITIKENIVDIAVYTKDLNDITDVDIEMIKKINDIVEDILHIDF